MLLFSYYEVSRPHTSVKLRTKFDRGKAIMGSATSALFARRDEATDRAAKARANAQKAKRAAERRCHQQNAEAWRELQARIPQLAELVSAKGRWESGNPEFKRGTYYYCLRYESERGNRSSLYMRRSIFGTIKYSVGPYWTWRRPERTSVWRISIFYASPATVLQVVNSHLA